MQFIKQRVGAELDHLRLHHTGVELRNVEQAVQQPLHRIDGKPDAVDDGSCTGAQGSIDGQRLGLKAQRMKRLAQIVAGGREKACLCARRGVELLTLTAQAVEQIDVLKA